MAKLDTVKTIKEFNDVGKINPRYALSGRDIVAIMHMDLDVYELIDNAFVFGYAQGYKAKTAEMKKRSVV